MTEASRPREQVIVCKGRRNFERIWIWFVISFRPGVFRPGGQCGRPRLGVPEADRLADTTAIPPLSRLFMVGMGMLCRHVGVRDHGNDQHSICY